MSAEFLVPVRDLDAAGRRFHFPVRAVWLRGVLEGTDVDAAGPDGDLDVRISKSGPDVVVRGTLAAELTVPCARCLEHARVPVREELTVLAVPSTTMRTPRGGPEHGAHGDLAEVAGDEADLLSYDGERLVLDDLVRDGLLLGIPMIPLCSEGCPGIRPIPSHGEGGAPIDPRLAPLLRFKNKA